MQPFHSICSAKREKDSLRCQAMEIGRTGITRSKPMAKRAQSHAKERPFLMMLTTSQSIQR